MKQSLGRMFRPKGGPLIYPYSIEREVADKVAAKLERLKENAQEKENSTRHRPR